MLMSKSQGIDTNNTNWGIAYTDSSGAIMTIGEKNKLLHLITLDNFARITVQLSQGPDLLTAT